MRKHRWEAQFYHHYGVSRKIRLLSWELFFSSRKVYRNEQFCIKCDIISLKWSFRNLASCVASQSHFRVSHCLGQPASIKVDWGMLCAEVCEEVISLLLEGRVCGFETEAAAASFPLWGKHNDKAPRISEEWNQNSHINHLTLQLEISVI